MGAPALAAKPGDGRKGGRKREAMNISKSDARATIYSIVLGAVADTADRTGLRAGPASEILVAAIVNALLGYEGIKRLLQAAKS